MSNPIAGSSSQWWRKPSNVQEGDSSAKSTKGSNSISDFTTFMKLLATELQNQDPTDPVSNTEYVSQMAQVESLSQLKNIGNSIAANSAYSLLGKKVSFQVVDPAGGVVKPESGIAESVVTRDNETYVVVNGQAVKLADIQKVDVVDPAKIRDKK
jgi:flagellar basal-body rod modification protein FlgD